MTVQAVVLPPAVQRQKEAVDRKIAELQQPAPPPSAEPSAPPPPAPALPEPPVPGDGNGTHPQETAPQPNPAGAESAPVSTTPPAEETPPPGKPREDWKQKYLTLQGMHQADLMQLRATIRDQEHAIQMLQRPPEPPPPPKARFTPEEKETFGEDLLALNERVAGEVADETAEAKLRELRENVKAVSGAVSRLHKDRFLERLAQRVPNWEDINRSEAWLRWLGQHDPITRVPRQSALDAAVAAYDADWVALIIERFHKETAAVAPPPGTTPAAVPGLAGQVTPPRQPGPTPRPPPAKIWKTSEIKKIAEDIGKRRYSPTRAQQLNDEIQQAIRERRVLIG